MKPIFVLLLVLLACVALVLLCNTNDAKGEMITVTETFHWTNTGDDLNAGCAKFIDCRFSTSEDSLLNYWSTCRKTSPTFDTLTLLCAGQFQSVRTPITVPQGRVIFAVKIGDDATDSLGVSKPNWSTISNRTSRWYADNVSPATPIDFTIE